MKRALAALAVAAAIALAPATAAAQPRFQSADGIQVLSVKRLDSRLLALTVSTAALPKPANIDVLLPSGYSSRKHRHRRYPVLYLFHGTSGGAADWTSQGDAEQTTAGWGLIVVMPDIALDKDGGGWCTNWVGDGHPQWETFHVDQLIPWIDRNLRTRAKRSGRAIAGLSQGGFCSMSYAARHPDLFETALSFSGAPDIAYDSEAQTLITPVINGTELFLDRVPPDSMFGPRSTDEINWAAHDPTTLAVNLRGMNLFLYTGNGQGGPLDTAVPSPEAQIIEGGVEILTKLFHQRLQALGIPSFYDSYGRGTHSWPYWARDLRQTIAGIMADFAHPQPAPSEVTYMTADPSYSIFGWQVAIDRRVEEFSTLKDADSSGFTLQGSGNATVVTPAFYRRGRIYTVTAGSQRMSERAGRWGRLTIPVLLGPSNTQQEYAGDSPPLGTTVYTTQVKVTPA